MFHVMPEDGRERKREANVTLAGGVGLGAFGVASAIAGGAVCPLCVVAAPALLGYGGYLRYRAWREERARRGDAEETSPTDTA